MNVFGFLKFWWNRQPPHRHVLIFIALAVVLLLISGSIFGKMGYLVILAALLALMCVYLVYSVCAEAVTNVIVQWKEYTLQKDQTGEDSVQ
jgi:amino acid permease